MTFEKLKKRRTLKRKSQQIRAERIKSMIIQRGLGVFKKYSIDKVVVFGSVADGVCGEMSDIDILKDLDNIKILDRLK